MIFRLNRKNRLIFCRTLRIHSKLTVRLLWWTIPNIVFFSGYVYDGHLHLLSSCRPTRWWLYGTTPTPSIWSGLQLFSTSWPQNYVLSLLFPPPIVYLIFLLSFHLVQCIVWLFACAAELLSAPFHLLHCVPMERSCGPIAASQWRGHVVQ